MLNNKLTLPIARRPLSNNSNTPRKRKDIPKPASPTPISETYFHYSAAFEKVRQSFGLNKKLTLFIYHHYCRILTLRICYFEHIYKSVYRTK